MAHKKLIGSFVFFSCLLSPNLKLFSQAGISLYVTDQTNIQLVVIDTDTFAITATIPLISQPGAGGPNGVAITPDNKFAYVGTVPLTSTPIPGVNAVNLSTAVVTEIQIDDGNTGQGVAITPDGTMAYVTNGSSKVFPIDVATNVAGSGITVGGDPDSIAIQPVGAPIQAYVANFSDQNISVINTATNAVIATITLPAGSLPTSVAITPTGLFTYVGVLDNTDVSVISTTSNTISATVDLGAFADAITIANVPNPPSSPDVPGIFAYAYIFGSQTVNVIDTSTNTIVGTINLPESSTTAFMASTPDGTQVFLVDNSNNVIEIDTATNTATVALALPGTAGGIAMGPVPPIPPPPNPKPLPPSNLTGELRKVIFATQTEYIHKLQWIPSTDTTVVDYLVFRNGIQIAVISASGPFEYNDQNRHKNESDVYTLVSVNALGVQSDPITLNFNGK